MSATPRPRLRLRREHRLRAGADFVRLKAEGRRQVQGCLIFNWQPTELALNRTSRVGVVTSKALGNAVVRNRARRLLREAFRRHRFDLTRSVSAVLVARKSIVGHRYQHVEADLLKALKHAGLLKADWASKPGQEAP
ncbi:MAG TPA: ribonuclease P protein component [Verrucomicrobiota bacterium]|nr:ribonuclease P protein component [Verrucomicrobiales bacterium]HRI12637.1 ribonuclease P protein component [Verrucomicrobiota bacterium]